MLVQVNKEYHYEGVGSIRSLGRNYISQHRFKEALVLANKALDIGEGMKETQKMITRSGELKFEASVPAFEQVAATNTTTSCIFDRSTGDFIILALVKAFLFKVPLMEEHFNENYIESSSYPKATFKGKVLNFNSNRTRCTSELNGPGSDCEYL